MGRRKDGWSPYAMGVLLGLLVIATFLFAHRSLGASSAFAKAASYLVKKFFPNHFKELDYFRLYKPTLNWTMVMVFFMFVGSLVSSILSGDFRFEVVADMWKKRFGPSKFWRLLAAFVGGILIGFGARMAGGCTSGHGLSGTSQLSVAGWVSTIFFFVGGIIMAHILYGRRDY